MTKNVLTQDQAFIDYVRKVSMFPLLSVKEERSLVDNWIVNKDVKSAHNLVTSHLRLVAKIAFQFRNYGLSLMELVAEGTLGLMKAVKSFNPDSGCRVATYAMWWIKSSIQEYILRTWSLVRIGTTTAQRKLFFNLRKLQKKMLTNKQIAEELSVNESEVLEMDRSLSGNGLFLNHENEERVSNSVAHINYEEQYADMQCRNYKQNLLHKAITKLDKRHREVLISRRLSEKPKTLKELSQLYKVSSERIRQIEAQAFKKVQSLIKAFRESSHSYNF